ncbi:hypothetical protein AURDEDRAFT_152153 [Auricularia subglabra TFB-10046 SS5]|nr:hypothetical protein AURDEDRAFT_152153 [Auricularia subglabra TFB-10046 SS5]
MDEVGIRESTWRCLWDEANRDPGDLNDRADRLRVGILHQCSDNIFDRHFLLDNVATPPMCAMLVLTVAHIAPRVASEFVIQNLHSMNRRTITHLLLKWPTVFSHDPDILIALVRSVSAYSLQRMHEDIGQIIWRTSRILYDCSDSDTGLVLQSALAALMLTWLHSPAFPTGTYVDAESWAPVEVALETVARSRIPGAQHPRKLHDLPHVRELACLAKVHYELKGQSVTWPLPGDFSYDVRDDWVPMVSELLKISVCGVDRRTRNTSELAGGSHGPVTLSASPGAAARTPATIRNAGLRPDDLAIPDASLNAVLGTGAPHTVPADTPPSTGATAGVGPSLDLRRLSGSLSYFPVAPGSLPVPALPGSDSEPHEQDEADITDGADAAAVVEILVVAGDSVPAVRRALVQGERSPPRAEAASRDDVAGAAALLGLGPRDQHASGAGAPGGSAGVPQQHAGSQETAPHSDGDETLPRDGGRHWDPDIESPLHIRTDGIGGRPDRGSQVERADIASLQTSTALGPTSKRKVSGRRAPDGAQPRVELPNTTALKVFETMARHEVRARDLRQSIATGMDHKIESPGVAHWGFGAVEGLRAAQRQHGRV